MIVDIRFLEGPWDNRVERLDLDRFNGRRVVVPLPPTPLREWWGDADLFAPMPELRSFTYEIAELGNHGWFGLPSAPLLAQSQQLVSEQVLNVPTGRRWAVDRHWRELAHFVRGEGAKEVPGTRELEEEPDTTRNQVLFRATVWTYK